MSRVIKFRAWDLDNEWMDDNFFLRSNDGVVYDTPSKTYDTPNTEIEENPSLVIMQFTGLQDKNGVDEYESDIVSMLQIDNSIHTCVIRYSDKYAKFVFCPAGEKWDFDRDVVENPYDRLKYEIIGNIHENPELIK